MIAWVPLVAVYTAIYMGAGSTPARAIRSALLTVLPFALLGLLVLRVPGRVPWHEGRRAGFFAAQLGLTVLYAVSAAAGVIASWTLESFLTTGRAEFPAPPIIAAWQGVIGGLIYLAIAGGAYAWENAQRLREEAARAAQADALRARIESLRLEERLQLRLDADPETMGELVPPFVLQPLVENAILHAVAPRKGGGRVAITARRHRDHLELEVCDDGPGMPSTIPPSPGLGLRLLRERLALLYAGNASLSLRPAEGGGLRATIDLPLDLEAASEPA